MDNPSHSDLLFSLLAPSTNIVVGSRLCFVLARELTKVKKPVLIIAQPHMYFYNAFQLSEDEGRSVLLLLLQNDCLRRLNDSIFHCQRFRTIRKAL